jgi:hypothetical protein
MKTIKYISITGKFTVGYSDWEVTDKVYDAIMKVYDKGGEISDCEHNDEDKSIVMEFFNNVPFERDCHSFEYEFDIEE